MSTGRNRQERNACTRIVPPHALRPLISSDRIANPDSRSGGLRFYDRGMSPDSPLIVVDADLSDEKLSELIARRAEYPELDHKKKIDSKRGATYWS